AVDRSGMFAGADRAIGANDRAPAPVPVVQFRSGLHESAIEERSKGDTRFAALRDEGRQLTLPQRRDGRNPRPGRIDILLLALDADEMPAETARNRACRAGSEK